MGEPGRIPIRAGVAVPLAELEFRFTRSGGPGGQHVNKAATQVELAFDVAGSPSLSDELKGRIVARLSGYVSKEGVLRLACQSSRSQAQNREEAIERFVALLRAALHVPKARRPTGPTRASGARRLESKRHRSALKRQRRPGSEDAF